MGHSITLHSDNSINTADLDSDMFSAALKENGYSTTSVDLESDKVLIKVHSRLMDDQFSDDELREDLVEGATRVADSFGYQITSANDEFVETDEEDDSWVR